ncbi:SEC-C domain-containing protein [Enterococcus faecium]|nr:SEC-C domain-containing protein [Enterococcus faecium]
MVGNEFIKCNMCDTTINLRMQLGYFDIPFHLNCPKCKTSIDGKILLENVFPYEITVNNAYSVDDYDFNFYSVELSAEFPTRKMKKKDLGIESYELSPYMRSLQFHQNGTIDSHRMMNETMVFANYYKSSWYELKAFFELFWNEQNNILRRNLESQLSKYPHLGVEKVLNNLDSCMCLHQLLITTTGISSTLGDENLNNYNGIANTILADLDNASAYMEFISKTEKNFTYAEKKAFGLIESFAKIYEQLIPVIILKRSNSLDRIDKEEYGIMTANFEELTSFYAKSYEWILENLDFVIGLNNIAVRGNYNSFKKEGKTFEDYLKLFKGNKLGWMNKDEPYSLPIQSLDSKKRNAIQHFDSEIDYVTQEISFRDRDNTQSMYLFDFATLCIDNLELVFYILELVYNLRRLNYFRQGLVPHLKKLEFPSSTAQNKEILGKIGRNSPCPCGSGKKYKKCCLK